MEVKEKFYKFYQGRHMTLERYHELFMAQVEVLDEVGITIEDDANRNMSKSKGWTLQSSLLMLWMDENLSQQTNKITDDEKLTNSL